MPRYVNRMAMVSEKDFHQIEAKHKDANHVYKFPRVTLPKRNQDAALRRTLQKFFSEV